MLTIIHVLFCMAQTSTFTNNLAGNVAMQYIYKQFMMIPNITSYQHLLWQALMESWWVSNTMQYKYDIHHQNILK